jgi:undecaprenyl-diphosphatase
MRKRLRSKILIGILLLVLIGILLLVYFNLSYFNKIVSGYVIKYGFIGILILSFFADLLEQPIGPEIPASIGVLLGLNVVLVIIFSVLGSYVGSLVNYFIGRKYLSFEVKQAFEKKDYGKYHKLFYKYGRLALVLAAISPIPWVAFCWLAGSFRMKLRQFVLYGLIPRAARILTIVLFVVYLESFFM